MLESFVSSLFFFHQRRTSEITKRRQVFDLAASWLLDRHNITAMADRPQLFDFDPNETAFCRQPTTKSRPLLRTASSLVVLELSPRSDNDGNTNQGGAVRLPNAQFRVSVRWVILLATVILVVGALGTGFVKCFGGGVHLGSFMSSDKTDAERKAMLDKFNAISGSLVALVLIPLEIVIIMSVSVTFLCFATDWMLQRGVNNFLFNTTTAIVAGVITYLLSNGLSALNVQLVSGDYIVKITAQDLAANSTMQDNQPVAKNGSLVTTWNASFAESSDGNSVLNTILRTKLIPFEDVQPTCNASSDLLLRSPMLSYGFASRSWQLETLQTALSPEKALEFTLDSDSMSRLPDDSDLPMNVDIATYLVVAATQVVPELTTSWDWTSDGTFEDTLALDGSYSYDGSNEIWSRADLLNISANDFIGTSTSVLHRMMAIPSNISIEDVRLGFKHFSISESVVVDALTLEIPTKPVQNSELDYDTANPGFELEYCNSEGCVASQYFGGSSVKVQPIVNAAAVCINDDGSEDLRVPADIFLSADEIMAKTCPRKSKTSMLLVGLGKQIVGGSWDTVVDEYGPQVVRLHGITMTYSVTVARLSWRMENLTMVFDAECENDGGCDGVRTPLNPTSDSDVLVIGETALPLEKLDYFSVPRYVSFYAPYMKWKPLVSLSPSMDFLTNTDFWSDGDLLLPRRFTTIKEGAGALKNINPSICDSNVDKYIKNIEKKHLYAEESLQMTYTAGFFFLFQNAVRHSPISNTSSLLAFAGNTQQLHIQASIPSINIYVSICGCVVLLAMSIGVAIVQKRSTMKVEQHANDEVVAEALLNSVKYPPMFLKMALEDLTASYPDKQRISLKDLQIQFAKFTKKQAQAGHRTSEFTLVSSPA